MSTLKWFAHAFSPTAVFINLTDERYVKLTDHHQPGQKLLFKLSKVNDLNSVVEGKVNLKVLDAGGKTVFKKSMPVVFSAFDRSSFPVEISLPKKPGGYLLVAEFMPDNSIKPVISRRYIKVGDLEDYKFFEMKSN
jgi:hypothetical protein